MFQNLVIYLFSMTEYVNALKISVYGQSIEKTLLLVGNKQMAI